MMAGKWRQLYLSNKKEKKKTFYFKVEYAAQAVWAPLLTCPMYSLLPDHLAAIMLCICKLPIHLFSNAISLVRVKAWKQSTAEQSQGPWCVVKAEMKHLLPNVSSTVLWISMPPNLTIIIPRCRKMWRTMAKEIPEKEVGNYLLHFRLKPHRPQISCV